MSEAEAAEAETTTTDATAAEATESTETQDTASDAGQEGGEKADASDKGEDKAEDADKAATDAEPFTVAVPEGFEDFSGEFEAFSTDMDAWLKANPDATPAEALQEAAARQAKSVKDGSETAAQEHEAQVDEWAEQTKADKEIGGDAFDENVAIAKTAIDTFGTPELKALLQQSGLGSHPEVIRFAKNAGAALQDGKVHGSGDEGGGVSGSSLNTRYPSSKSSG